METYSSLKELYEAMSKWDGCELSKQANFVPGVGNPKADIMFIGEAPGKKEDELKEPFVGAAGKLLNELLASIGLERPDVYISNVVKFRPPNNRDPSEEEKALCLPWLKQEIVLIQPKVICPLGRHAMGYFLPNASISAIHGTVQTTDKGIPIFPLYHPAAALYNGGLRETLFKDMQTLNQFLEAYFKKLQTVS